MRTAGATISTATVIMRPRNMPSDRSLVAAAAPSAAAAMNPNSAIRLVSWEKVPGSPARPKLCGSTAWNSSRKP